MKPVEGLSEPAGGGRRASASGRAAASRAGSGRLRGGRPAALREPRPPSRGGPGQRARRRGHRPGRLPPGVPGLVPVRRDRRPRLALHDRPAPGLQPAAQPPAAARRDPTDRAAAVGRSGRPGPVGCARASRRPDPVGPPAQRRRRLQPARDRGDARGARGDRRELAVARPGGPPPGPRSRPTRPDRHPGASAGVDTVANHGGVACPRPPRQSHRVVERREAPTPPSPDRPVVRVELPGARAVRAGRAGSGRRARHDRPPRGAQRARRRRHGRAGRCLRDDSTRTRPAGSSS